MRIAIIGRRPDTANYERFFSLLPAQAHTTLSLDALYGFDAVVLPGGGDITPAFFGERCCGSRDIDTELDLLQFKALDHAVLHGLPVLGICKGLQLINVAFGGSIIQDLPDAGLHRAPGRDLYHGTRIAPGSFLASLYGTAMTVNSAHHQGIGRLGRDLVPIQWSVPDGCIEGVTHNSLPILGLQWHPERLEEGAAHADASRILRFFRRSVPAG